MRKLLVWLPILALLASPAAWAGDMMIHIFHGKIDPSEAKIAVGDTITFHNMNPMPGGHTVVADDGSFESPPLDKDGQWKHTFSEAGSFGVHLKQHPEAKATIVVE